MLKRIEPILKFELRVVEVHVHSEQDAPLRMKSIDYENRVETGASDRWSGRNLRGVGALTVQPVIGVEKAESLLPWRWAAPAQILACEACHKAGGESAQGEAPLRAIAHAFEARLEASQTLGLCLLGGE